VSCRLDYCNPLLAGIAKDHLRRLQSVRNVAARLVSGARPHDHITPVLATFHWLPIRQRDIFILSTRRYLVDVCELAASMEGLLQSLWCPELSWCPGLGFRLNSAALLCAVLEPGPDYSQHFDHQNLRCSHSLVSSRPICSTTKNNNNNNNNKLVSVTAVSYASVRRRCDCFSDIGASADYQN